MSETFGPVCVEPSRFTLGDKLRIEWPVLLVLISGLWYLAMALGDIKALLTGLDTRQRTMEAELMRIHDVVERNVERITRLEATQPK